MAEYIVDALVYKMAYLFEYSSEQFQTLVVVLKANLRVMKKTQYGMLGHRIAI